MKQTLSQKLNKNNKTLLENWLQMQLNDDSLREDVISNEEIREQSSEILNELGELLGSDKFDDPNSSPYQSLTDNIAGLSISRARQGFSAKETATFLSTLRQTLLEFIEKQYKDKPEEAISELLKVSKLLDEMSSHAFETYLKSREEIILRQTSEIADISTPVIKVWDGILALPIIGTLDSNRTQYVMENLLMEIVNTGSSIAILDISGVPAVDSLVAQHLIKTVSATRLMGAECIISGIRPEIAQTIVHLGIDLSSIVTKATLSSALKHAFNNLKLEVKNKPVHSLKGHS